MEQENPKSTDFTGVIIGAALAPVFFALDYFCGAAVARTVSISVGMLMLAVRIRWNLRKHLWFWETIIVVLLLHVPLFVLIKWPDQWVPWVFILPFALADCLVALGTIWVAEKIFGRTEDSSLDS